MGSALSKRDWLRSYLQTGHKAYVLAGTPPPAFVYRDIKDELGADVDPMHRIEARMVLLRHGIDVKYALKRFLNELQEHHGEKRVERFIYWVETGQVAAYSQRQRQELYADRKRLKQEIIKPPKNPHCGGLLRTKGSG